MWKSFVFRSRCIYKDIFFNLDHLLDLICWSSWLLLYCDWVHYVLTRNTPADAFPAWFELPRCRVIGINRRWFKMPSFLLTITAYVWYCFKICCIIHSLTQYCIVNPGCSSELKVVPLYYVQSVLCPIVLCAFNPLYILLNHFCLAGIFKYENMIPHYLSVLLKQTCTADIFALFS